VAIILVATLYKAPADADVSTSKLSEVSVLNGAMTKIWTPNAVPPFPGISGGKV
jgi:hypothetical protein